MFYALPAETVFEAKQRTRRATVYLFLVLTTLYVVFFNLLLLAAYLFFDRREFMKTFPTVPVIAYYATALAVVLAVVHFYWARAKTLDDMLEQIEAKPADPLDDYHSAFINVVSELEGATGIRGIRPVVLNSPGSNAFSLQDSKGQCAIGATEGLLSRLSRPELSAVCAHEAAHLVHEDSRLITTATFLFSVFEQINAALGAVFSINPENRSRSTGRSGLRVRGSGQGVFLILLLWVISGLGYLVTRLVFSVISREREYYADADGVQMCKDPLAMAESLYKIANRYRGDLPQSFGALFILNPTESTLDEDEGLYSDIFSNHPPVSKRISKLLTWARSDLKTVQEAVEKEEKTPQAPSASPTPENGARFMTYQDNQWVGPYSALQLLALGSVTPATWICPEGGQQVTKASEVAELNPLFTKQVQGTVSRAACPRCKVPLVTETYEGAQVEQCSFCKGYLLRGGVLERLITRDEHHFAPEDIQNARTWKASQRGDLFERDAFPAIHCPHCGGPMGKAIHSYITQVVIDRCSDDKCRSIWCDGAELETIQMLLQDAKQGLS